MRTLLLLLSLSLASCGSSPDISDETMIGQLMRLNEKVIRENVDLQNQNKKLAEDNAILKLNYSMSQ